MIVFLCLIVGFSITACTAQQTGGVHLEDVARYRTGMAYGLVIKDSYAYITTNNDLLIIDIANPRKPRRIGKLKLGQPAFALKVQADKAYLAAMDNGMVVSDISEPENPKVVGKYYDGGSVRRLELTDHYCINSDFEKGLNMLDISDVTSPQKVGNIKYDRIRDFEIANNLVYLVDLSTGLKVVEISDKTNPVEVTAVDETEGAASVAIDGNRLFLGFFNGLIKIFDIIDPKSPHLLTTIKCHGEVLGMIAADNYLFINFKGVLIKEISDLDKIVDVGHHRRGEGAHGIVYQDGFVYYVKSHLTIFKIIKGY